MIKHYSQGEIRRLAADYDVQGAVHLPGFVGNAGLTRLQEVVDAALATADPVSPSQRSEGRLTLRYLWRENPDLRQMLLQQAVAEPIARIIGSKTLRFWFDLTFMPSCCIRA